MSIHQSKRVNGVVTKQQYAVTTAGYYDLAEYSLYDCVNEKRLNEIAVKLNTAADSLWDLMIAKLEPLQDRIRAEFRKTEE